MSNSEVKVTVRGIIVSDGKLLVFKLHPEIGIWSLPGGHLEFGESLTEAMERELLEETNVKPVVGKIVAINQMILPERHRVEFFFEILNSEDYLKIDTSKASHGHEISAWQFADPQDKDIDIRPNFLKTFVPKLSEGISEPLVVVSR